VYGRKIIPMSPTLADVLQEYLHYRKGEPDDYLFCNQYGGKGDYSTTQDQLIRYNKSRGVAKISSHLYRHTFTKHWILNGGDIFRLQKILGHSDLSVVKEYVNLFSDELAIDFDKFNPLDNLGVRNKGTIKMGGKR
jgi:integrase/recombinase XerD